jgi:carbamoyl-phosphate synthase small subunit
MIGNYGVNSEDIESASGNPSVSGVISREHSRNYSRWRAEQSLGDWLTDKGVPILENIDTRKLTRHLRSEGAMKGIVAPGEGPTDEIRSALNVSPSMVGLDLASRATCPQEVHSKARGDSRHHIAAFDFGMKQNIIRMFNQRGCDVTVLPSTTSAARVKELNPDGLFLSNGPGDPSAVTYAFPVIKELVETGLPTFGICLGHQLLSLAFGADTTKLPYGHRGGNHPVRDNTSGKVLITSQNHGFAVAATTNGVSGAKALEVTHVNLNDHTVEGVRHRELPAFAVQYHPEAAPGPHDARNHFGQFLQTLDRQ